MLGYLLENQKMETSKQDEFDQGMNKLIKNILEIAEITLKNDVSQEKWNRFRKMILDRTNQFKRLFKSGNYSYVFGIKENK